MLLDLVVDGVVIGVGSALTLASGFLITMVTQSMIPEANKARDLDQQGCHLIYAVGYALHTWELSRQFPISPYF